MSAAQVLRPTPRGDGTPGGHRVQVVMPYAPGHRAWLRDVCGATTRPEWDRRRRAWLVARPHFRGVGTVNVGPDRLLVEIVQRTWTAKRASGESARADHDPTVIRTVAPAAVQVRREPGTDRDAPGGMTPHAARALAKMLAKAAARAEAIGAAPHDDGQAKP